MVPAVLLCWDLFLTDCVWVDEQKRSRRKKSKKTKKDVSKPVSGALRRIY